jgi:hypothetical protein
LSQTESFLTVVFVSTESDTTLAAESVESIGSVITVFIESLPELLERLELHAASARNIASKAQKNLGRGAIITV